MKNKMNINTFIAEYAIIIIFIVLFAAMSIFAPNFLTGSNIANVLRQVSINGICAIGMTFVILTGGIDLSVGAIIGVSGVLTAMMMIATMGTMTSLRGVAYLITGGTPVFGFDSRYAVIGQGYVGAVPIPVIILVLSFAAGIFFLSKTRHSRYIYGVGGNEEVARLSGISVHRIKAFVYAVSGFCSALAGLVMLGRLNSGQPRAGESYEMDVITAVVLGGVSLTGGVGKISHVVFGVLIIGVLTNGMTMMAVDDYWQRVVKGLVLLLAVGFDRFIQKRQQKSE